MKATGINIEWGSPAGYCARGINRCFGGQVFARAPTCTLWPYREAGVLGVMSSELFAIEDHPYWNEFQASRKLWNEEQIGVQREAPVIPQ